MEVGKVEWMLVVRVEVKWWSSAGVGAGVCAGVGASVRCWRKVLASTMPKWKYLSARSLRVGSWSRCLESEPGSQELVPE